MFDFLLDFAERASSQDNNVDGDNPPRLLSSTHHQVAGCCAKKKRSGSFFPHNPVFFLRAFHTVLIFVLLQFCWVKSRPWSVVSQVGTNLFIHDKHQYNLERNRCKHLKGLLRECVRRKVGGSQPF